MTLVSCLSWLTRSTRQSLWNLRSMTSSLYLNYRNLSLVDQMLSTNILSHLQIGTCCLNTLELWIPTFEILGKLITSKLHAVVTSQLIPWKFSSWIDVSSIFATYFACFRKFTHLLHATKDSGYGLHHSSIEAILLLHQSLPAYQIWISWSFPDSDNFPLAPGNNKH